MTKTPTSDANSTENTHSPEQVHPLASLIGAWKDTDKLKALGERVEEYRREVDATEEKSEAKEQKEQKINRRG
jgi:hypothetical protein